MPDLDILKGVPSWKILGIAALGGAFILFSGSQVSSAVQADNTRDDAAYVNRAEYQEVRDRLVRIESKLDELLRGK